MSDYPYLGIDNSSFDEPHEEPTRTFYTMYTVELEYGMDIEATSEQEAKEKMMGYIKELPTEDYEDMLLNDTFVMKEGVRVAK